METLTPKKQAIQERNDRILELARQMILREGYHGLSLESLASELGVSRGTIYNHFPSKEEIILALLVQTTDVRRSMFQRAASHSAPPRTRMAAIGVACELFVRLYPDHFRFEQIVKLDSIWNKTSQQRRSLVKACQMQCVGIVAGIARDAVVQGHLELPKGFAPEALVFGLWSLSEGAYSTIATSDSLAEMGMTNPFPDVRRNLISLQDGYDWKPLSSEVDYFKILEQLANDVFPDELKRLNEPW